LSAIARQIAAELQTLDLQRNVEFIIAPGLNENGDPNLLKIMLENLLNNAWKFTSKKEQAHIEFNVLDSPREAPSKEAGRGAEGEGQVFFRAR
jgi:signal transduction histidine kinase